eukprot:CAMPEP_0182417158 /NCGR_PEP_ID=MMETSP1167-20130531/1550_1 /TAXON_ID=2988 /ORGANISM="Mallomonas Sp, Strain CCMP3275" /LENGTH=463 /DNA_ID=CAMNT_0024590499 /DNA_START=161 /DNA_END=1552 /DNA_ORIENTATION=-
MGISVNDIASFVVNSLVIVGGIGVFAIALLYANQDKMLYIPNPPGFPKEPRSNPRGFSSPSEWTRRGRRCKHKTDPQSIPYEEHFLETSDGKKIHVWLLLQDNSMDVPTIIYFHGNAANMGLRLKNVAEMYAVTGANILMMDYRGYGSSEGVPSEKGLNIDASTVLLFACTHPKLKGSPMVAFGRSLGGAVSLSLSSNHPTLVDGIILENTFTSVAEMVDVLMPWVARLKHLVLRIGWHSDRVIASLSQPILFISGDSDQLVPPSHMTSLYHHATKTTLKDFYSVLGGTHNDTWEVGGMEYYKKISDFLKRVVEKREREREKEKEEEKEREKGRLLNGKEEREREEGSGNISNDMDNERERERKREKDMTVIDTASLPAEKEREREEEKERERETYEGSGCVSGEEREREREREEKTIEREREEKIIERGNEKQDAINETKRDDEEESEQCIIPTMGRDFRVT